MIANPIPWPNGARCAVAMYTAQDLHDLVEPVRASSRMKNYHATALYPLARDKVRSYRRVLRS